MTTVTNNPKEKMRMNIELADNGIIIRNPDCEDEVTLAMEKNAADGAWHGDEERAIGRKIYKWLMDEVIDKHTDFIITNFDIDIMATFKGREFK